MAALVVQPVDLLGRHRGHSVCRVAVDEYDRELVQGLRTELGSRYEIAR